MLVKLYSYCINERLYMFSKWSCRLGFNVLRWMSALWYGSCTFRLDLVTCCVVLVLCFLYAVPCGGSSIELTTSGSGPVGPGSAGRHSVAWGVTSVRGCLDVLV